MHCNSDTSVEDFKRVRSSVLIRFNKLKIHSIAALENGKEASTSTNLVRLRYFNAPDGPLASLTLISIPTSGDAGRGWWENSLCALLKSSSQIKFLHINKQGAVKHCILISICHMRVARHSS